MVTTTMKDVAERAGVSVATVSRVLNDTGFVSEELRERVNDAMDALNYRPSNVARSLRRQQTQTVAVMVPQLDLPFFSTLTLAIQQRLFEDGYYTFTCSTMESSFEESAYIDMLLGQRVDGVIIAPTGHSAENLNRLKQANVPVVLVDRNIPEVEGIDRVLFDNFHGGFLAAQHLIKLGHERIVIFGGPKHSGAIIQRIEGAKKAFQDHPHIDVEVITPQSDRLLQFDIDYERALAMLADNPPSGVFALTDDSAVAVIHAARKLDMTLPDELSIMGFDDIPLAKYSLPSLTTIAQPIKDMGEQTAEILLERLQNPDMEPMTKINDAELIVRDSTQTSERS